jgi:Tol biopolymer transport system component
VPNDTNAVRDVFVKDLVSNSTVRVSMNSDGTQPTTNNEFEGMPTSISADGRHVAFLTFSRLLPRDTNIHNDVYVKDMLTGELDLVSTASDETLANFRNHTPYISANGRYVVFSSQASNFVPEDTDIGPDIYIKDRVTRQIRLASANAAGVRASESSLNPVVSADGRFVAFMSYSRDLALPANPANPDVYIKDMQTGAVERAQANAAGTLIGGTAGAPAITPDGRYVAFQLNFYSASTGTMTRLYLKDRSTGEPIRIDRTSGGVLQTTGAAITPAISADGRFVSFASNNSNVTLSDFNGLQDVFVFDRNWVTSQRAAVTSGTRSNGDSGEGMISRDGSRVMYTSDASNVVDGDSDGNLVSSPGTAAYPSPRHAAYGRMILAQMRVQPLLMGPADGIHSTNTLQTNFIS